MGIVVSLNQNQFMKLPVKIWISLGIFFFSCEVFAQESTSSHKDSLNSVVNEYYKLSLKIYQEGSTVDDIDDIFELFTDDFTYVHPKYGGTYTRQDLYNGYKRNQKNGMYNGSIIDIKVVKRIAGLNAVVVERKLVIKENDKIVDDEGRMTLFEFKEGKIVRIFEYW